MTGEIGLKYGSRKHSGRAKVKGNTMALHFYILLPLVPIKYQLPTPQPIQDLIGQGHYSKVNGQIKATLVLVSNNNMYINIKPYFCLSYRSILKYRVIDVF